VQLRPGTKEVRNNNNQTAFIEYQVSKYFKRNILSGILNIPIVIKIACKPEGFFINLIFTCNFFLEVWNIIKPVLGVLAIPLNIPCAGF
jgi:hypothetical protein